MHSSTEIFSVLTLTLLLKNFKEYCKNKFPNVSIDNQPDSIIFDDLDDLLMGGDGHRADVLETVLAAPGVEQTRDHRRHLVVLAAVAQLDMIADGGEGFDRWLGVQFLRHGYCLG